MLGGDLVTHLRVDLLRDTALPYLWSEDFLYRMLNEAQRQFARKTYSIIDTIEIETELPTTDVEGNAVGVPVYELPVHVLFVFSVQNSNGRPLRNWTRRRIPNFNVTGVGSPQAYSMDDNIRHIRFFPPPDGYGGTAGAAGIHTFEARVALRPTADIEEDTEPQIPEEYHMDLCDFVAWKALTLPDEDGQNLAIAKEFKGAWLDRISAAKADIYQRMMGADARATQDWTMAGSGN